MSEGQVNLILTNLYAAEAIVMSCSYIFQAKLAKIVLGLLNLGQVFNGHRRPVRDARGKARLGWLVPDGYVQ